MDIRLKAILFGISTYFITILGFYIVISFIAFSLLYYEVTIGVVILPILVFPSGPIVSGYVSGKIEGKNGWFYGLTVSFFCTSILLLLIQFTGKLWTVFAIIVFGSFLGMVSGCWGQKKQKISFGL